MKIISHLVREYKTFRAAENLQKRLQTSYDKAGIQADFIVTEVSSHKKRLIFPGKVIYQVVQIERKSNV